MKENSELILGIYVDDGILIENNQTEIDDVLNLRKEFKISVAKKPTHYVGFEITREKNITKLSQREHILKLLGENGMENAKPARIPMQPANGAETEQENKQFPYRETIGSLLYVSTKTRPDISYAVGFCNKYVEEPSQDRVNDVKYILRYLSGNTEQGIVYRNTKKSNIIEAFCDADYAGDPKTRKSTTGYVILYADGAISWCSRKQPVIALSSTEAKYIAAAECCKELLYLKSLFEEILNEPVMIELNVELFECSAIALIKSGIVNKRSKHINVKFRFIHELVKDGAVKVKYCPTNVQLADIFTKPLSAVKFNDLRDRLLK